jgi:hypothetical protein
VCILFGGMFFYSSKQSDTTFEKEYAIYDDLAAQADNAAYIPGAQVNPIRLELDHTLAQVLDQSTSPSNRLSLSTQGLEYLTVSEAQIAAISSTSAKVDAHIAKMQIDSLNTITSSDAARQIIALAKNRSSVISDIRAYSYRADFEIRQIFDRIVTDKGTLTSAYIVELNNEIPAVEAQFNQRSNLYTELQSTSQKIHDIYSTLGVTSTAHTPVP